MLLYIILAVMNEIFEFVLSLRPYVSHISYLLSPFLSVRLTSPNLRQKRLWHLPRTVTQRCRCSLKRLLILFSMRSAFVFFTFYFFLFLFFFCLIVTAVAASTVVNNSEFSETPNMFFNFRICELYTRIYIHIRYVPLPIRVCT